jgi:pilus assembly protein CpaB
MRKSAQTTQIMEKKEKTIKIVVVTKKLTRGVRLTKGDLKLREWPKRLAAQNYIRNLNEAEGRVVISKTIPGEPLLKEKLAPVESVEGLSTLIPVGYRAITIRVTEVTGVGGFLLPGSRVDVHATFKVKVNALKGKKRGGSSEKDIYITRTILQDVEVLAAGAEKEAAQKKGRIKVPVVTLLLTPDNSDKLALAATASESIWLSMRKPRDGAKRKKVKLLTINQILYPKKKKKVESSRPKIVARIRPRKLKKGAHHVVEIFHGGKKSLARF